MYIHMYTCMYVPVRGGQMTDGLGYYLQEMVLSFKVGCLIDLELTH